MKAVLIDFLASAILAAILTTGAILSWWFIEWDVRMPDAFLVRMTFSVSFAFFLSRQGKPKAARPTLPTDPSQGRPAKTEES